MPPTVALATLGCKVNQAETDDLAAAFARAGFSRADFRKAADVYVLNTCTVTHIADRKSRALLRQARRLSPAALLVATGCYASVSPAQVAELGVDLIVPNADKARLVELVLAAGSFSPCAAGVAGPGRTRAYLKVQDGCDNRCTYCIVPRARGRQRSEPLAALLDAARARAAAGYQELVLTGVHVGAYGRGVENAGVTLAGLLRQLLDATDLPRLRLSSIEPEDVTPELLALWSASGGRLCRHFHLPLQSGCEATLRRMGRRYRAAAYADLVADIRRTVPGVAITADIMAGFPGEDEAEFAESLAFARAVGFAGLHVFKYSPRPGTPAARYAGQVPPAVARARSEALQAVGASSAATFRESLRDQTLSVLFEERQGRHNTGLTDNYVRVYVAGEDNLENLVCATRLLAPHEDGLLGKLA
ncbi:MAG: tRNA (N(6)-L-threonylcarbamoyladenosine(37)-C(2))-methylthiotransferase MtaB [Chloroflexota bacterium]